MENPNEIFLYIAIIAGVAFIVLFIVLLRDTINKRRNAQHETQEYYVATTDADDDDKSSEPYYRLDLYDDDDFDDLTPENWE